MKKSENVTADQNKIVTGFHYNEENKDIKNNISVFHLLFAHDGSEAGNYYNQYTIEFIETQYNEQWEKKKFDVIEEVKNQFSLNSKRYLEQKIEKNEFNSNEDILENKIIKLDKEKELTLKKCLIDEIGNPIFKNNGFEPNYNVFIKDNFLEIRIELPGNAKPEVCTPKFTGENTIITVLGQKECDKDPKNPEDCIYNSREYGKFDIDIKFKTEEIKINSTLKENQFKKGVLFLKYQLDTEEKNENTKIECEEEI